MDLHPKKFDFRAFTHPLYRSQKRMIVKKVSEKKMEGRASSASPILAHHSTTQWAYASTLEHMTATLHLNAEPSYLETLALSPKMHWVSQCNKSSYSPCSSQPRDSTRILQTKHKSQLRRKKEPLSPLYPQSLGFRMAPSLTTPIVTNFSKFLKIIRMLDSSAGRAGP